MSNKTNRILKTPRIARFLSFHCSMTCFTCKVKAIEKGITKEEFHEVWEYRDNSELKEIKERDEEN